MLAVCLCILLACVTGAWRTDVIATSPRCRRLPYPSVPYRICAHVQQVPMATISSLGGWWWRRTGAYDGWNVVESTLYQYRFTLDSWSGARSILYILFETIYIYIWCMWKYLPELKSMDADSRYQFVLWWTLTFIERICYRIWLVHIHIYVHSSPLWTSMRKRA